MSFNRIPTALAILAATALSACLAHQGINAPGDPAKPVTAVAETRVTTDSAVDADDPALWADSRNPGRALLFSTDKSDGLYVHDLDGTVRQFLSDGPLNNVDLRPGFVVDGREQVLVAASDRAQSGIRAYLLDPDTLATRPFGFIPTEIGEPYGFCLGQRGNDVYALISNKDGRMQQIRMTAGAEGVVGNVVRELKVATQPEGCVVDDAAQSLYVGEEDVGVWRFGFDPAGPALATAIARVDNQRIAADVEGLALIRDGGRQYLLVSSQGDSTYGVFRIEGDAHVYVGRFAVVDGPVIDGVSSTDGLSAWSGPIGGYPEGVLAMHDDKDAPLRGQQNFKLVDWRDVKTALGL